MPFLGDFRQLFELFPETNYFCIRNPEPLEAEILVPHGLRRGRGCRWRHGCRVQGARVALDLAGGCVDGCLIGRGLQGIYGLLGCGGVRLDGGLETGEIGHNVVLVFGDVEKEIPFGEVVEEGHEV